MKLKFAKQPFQTTAFSLVDDDQLTLLETQYGIGNALLIDEETMLANMRAVQKRNRLPLSE